MSLIERIQALQKADLDNLIEIDRIGVESRKDLYIGEPKKFKQVDEELLAEYNSQFPLEDRKFRKYFVPESPQLGRAELLPIENEVNLRQQITTKTQEIGVFEMSLVNDERSLEYLDDELNNLSLFDVARKKQIAANKATIRKDMRFKKAAIIKKNGEIQSLEQRIIDTNLNILTNEARVTQQTLENREAVIAYQQQLNSLNKGAFSQTQLPSENEQQYLQRLEQTAQVETIADALDNSKEITKRRFLDKMKELVRLDYKIEQIANSVDPFGEVDTKLAVLKKFELFKAKYIKTFGLNNPNVTTDDTIQFIKDFVAAPASEIKDVGVKGLTTKVVNDVLLVGKADKTLFLIPARVPIGRGKETNILLYSTTGARQSYSTWIDKPSEMPPNQAPSSYDVELETGISLKDLEYRFGSKNPVSIAIQIMKEFSLIPLPSDELYPETYQTKKDAAQATGKTKTMYGYGLNGDKIPEMIQFGKLILYLHKLFYKNILSIKHNNNISIAGLKNVKVSDKFVSIIMNMFSDISPSLSDISSLSTLEKQLYDRILYLAGLNKAFQHTKETSVDELKKRMMLIEGEISAGNNNPMLFDELYKITHSLKDFGVLSQKSLKSYLAQFQK